MLVSRKEEAAETRNSVDKAQTHVAERKPRHYGAPLRHHSGKGKPVETGNQSVVARAGVGGGGWQQRGVGALWGATAMVHVSITRVLQHVPPSKLTTGH